MKISLLITCTIFSIYSYCQIDKGTVILAGDIGFSDNSSERKFLGVTVDSEEYQRFFFNPKVGAFISKNVALGLGFGIESIDRTFTSRTDINIPENTGTTDISTRFINPFINLQSQVTDKLWINCGLEARIGNGESKYTSSPFSDVEGEINFFEFNMTPGLYYFVSKKIAVTLNYGSFTYSDSEETVVLSSGADDTETDKDIGFNFGVESFKVGFVFVFSKKTD